MSTIRFSIPAIPVAQPRQRHAMIGGHVRNYTPTKHPVNAFKAATQIAASEAYKGPPLTGPLIVALTFVMPRPKSKNWKSREMPRYPHDGKPDRDNLMKSFQDALNGLLWADDSQIFDGPVRKLVAGGNEQPHVEVEVTHSMTQD